jgi:hypothetical protein
VNLLKTAKIVRAIADGEYVVLRDEAVDKAVDIAAEKAMERFLQSIGASGAAAGTLSGGVLTAAKTIKESYETLEQEDCLTLMQVSFVAVEKDARLRAGKNNVIPNAAVEAYIRDYLPGGGKDPSGGNRSDNRRALQCFVDRELSPSERIIVSSQWAEDASPANPRIFIDRTLGRATDVIRSAADRHEPPKGLQLAVRVMLKDANTVAAMERDRKKLIRLMQQGGRQRLEAVAAAMRVSDEARELLCRKLAMYRAGEGRARGQDCAHLLSNASGTYKADWGPLICLAAGKTVNCRYSTKGKWLLRLSHDPAKNKLIGEWDHNGVGGDNRKGPAEFSLNGACEVSGGGYGYEGKKITRGWKVHGKIK